MRANLVINNKVPDGALDAKYKAVGMGIELNEGKKEAAIARSRKLVRKILKRKCPSAPGAR